MYALVDINGKQYRAEKGARLKVDSLTKEEGDRMEFESVLMVSDEGQVKIGTPYVEGSSVEATVQAQGKGRKVDVIKFKRRKNYKRAHGHRQAYTEIRVTGIKG